MWYETITSIVRQIKEEKPLILNITNQVTMDFVANGLLSIGSSPLMTQGMREIADLVQLAQAIVINIGTLNEEFIKLCEQACFLANELGKPLIFDPVGAGASQYRTEICLYLLKHYRFSVIRGNASELFALCGFSQTTKGVDTRLATQDIIETAKIFSALHHNTILAISGQTDAVIQGEQVELFSRGSILMPLVTGTGCLLSAVVGAFQAIQSDYLSTCAAVLFYSVCGERAAPFAAGPGSFKVQFLDALAKTPLRGDYEAA